MTANDSKSPWAWDRRDRPKGGWFDLVELSLGVTCPEWCVTDPAATGDGPLCFVHAAQAVEDGVLDPADLTIVPAPEAREDAVGAR